MDGGGCRSPSQHYLVGSVGLVGGLDVGSKLLRWPASNTLDDNDCIYIMRWMHEHWGSLRLISQEGMEAFQEKLNEILWMGNGFANAGAIPRWVHEVGEAETAAYMERRAAEKTSEPRWIFEQALLQQHAHMADVTAASEDLRTRGEVVTWEEWRYMVGSAMRCRLPVRADARADRARRASRSRAARARPRARDSRTYSQSTDLAPAERARQEDKGRRERYATLGKEKVYVHK